MCDDMTMTHEELEMVKNLRDSLRSAEQKLRRVDEVCDRLTGPGCPPDRRATVQIVVDTIRTALSEP